MTNAAPTQADLEWANDRLRQLFRCLEGVEAEQGADAARQKWKRFYVETMICDGLPLDTPPPWREFLPSLARDSSSTVH